MSAHLCVYTMVNAQLPQASTQRLLFASHDVDLRMVRASQAGTVHPG